MIFKNLKDKFFDKGNRRGTSLVTLSLEQSGSNKNLGKSQLYTAFTVAEVLIVIGIIGMVANLTIPTLMKNIEKEQYATMLKKSINTFQQGITMMMQAEGVETFELTTVMTCPEVTGGGNSINSTCIDAEVKKYFKVLKSSSDIGGPIVTTPYTWLKRWNDGLSDLFRATYYDFLTPDGAVAAFRPLSPCTDMANENGDKRCGFIYLDVNGAKKPNKFGKDTFILYFSNLGKVGGYRDKPSTNVDGYWQSPTDNCGTPGQLATATDIYGGACAARIIENGWDIDYY